MLFDQSFDFFRSVVVTCYSISCLTFIDQLCLHVIRSVVLTFIDQLWLHVIRSVVCLFSISCGCMLFASCVFFRSVVVTCYSISCVTFFDQLWLHIIRSVVCLFRLACSRPSVSGSVRRAAGERGKNEEGPEPPRSRSLTLNRFIFRSPLFSFVSTN